MAALLIIFGIGVLAAHSVYKKYIPSIMPVYFLSAFLIALGGIILTFLLKEKISKALAVLGFCLIPFLWTAFLIKGDLNPYISSFDASLYIPHNAGVVLTSKPYARGMRYFTGQNIAVLDINGSNYFSPHPIPILTTTAQLSDFLHTQRITYAVLKKGGYKEITTNLPANKFKTHLLTVLGYNYVLTIEPIK